MPGGRRSSSPSPASGVRCGCQYYQSSDPLPERRSLVGTPPPLAQHRLQHEMEAAQEPLRQHHEPPRQPEPQEPEAQEPSQEPAEEEPQKPPPIAQENRHKDMGDHEYEPITPLPVPPPPVKVPEIETKKEFAFKKVLGRHRQKAKEKRRVIKLPNSDQVIIPLHGDSDEEINPDRYENKQGEEEPAVEVEDGETTTEGGPATSSQADTSQLEQLPLDKAARSKEASPKGFGQRIRSHAGRIRTRITNMPRPKFERPKIKMPEKPKFLKEKPKFLTERPKFLKERPKIKIPQRPKFLKERPKFTMPQRPKFNIKRPDISMPKFDFVRKKNRQGTPPPAKQKPKPTSSLKRPLKDHPSSTMSSTGSKRNLFESIKYRTYPRFFNRRKKEKGKRVSTPPPRMTATESSPQSSPETRRPTRRYQDTKWVETFRDIKYVDETGSEQKGSNNYSGTEENVEQFDEDTRYLNNVVRLEDGHKFMKAKAESASSVMDSDKEQASSQGSSTARRRAGVLEEIDSDEFFLREKGLSREDVDVSRYLSLEIRDAFRSPKNALASLDTDLYYEEDYDEDEEPEPPQRRKTKEPKPPERSKSAERRRRSGSGQQQQEFNTFPMRPARRKQSEPLVGTPSPTVQKPPRKYRSKSDTRQTSMPSLHTGPDEEQSPRPPVRRRSAKDLTRKSEIEETTPIIKMPLADVHAGDALEPEREIEVQEMEVQKTEVAPMAPLRKERSRGTSVGDEDRTSRGVESLQSEQLPDEDEELPQEGGVVNEEDMEEAEKEKTKQLETMEVPGYATVAKVRPPRPPPPPPTRQRKLTPMVTPLRNIKNHSINFFFTYPRRAIKSLQKPPTRPVRNYSTLGPSRPPRRNRVFREPVYVDGDKDPPTEEKKIEKDELEELEAKIIAELAKEDEESRDLQSGEVVEKMKGRPLPPPPRPPRKPKDYDSLKKKKKIEDVERYRGEEEEEEEEEVCRILRESTKEIPPVRIETTRLVYREHELEQPPQHPSRDDFFSVFSRIKPPPEPEVDGIEDESLDKRISVQQQTSFDIDVDILDSSRQAPISEVTVSVQTDPLPEDFIVDEQETGSIASEPTATTALLETINELEIEPAVRPERRRKLEPLTSEPLAETVRSEEDRHVSERVVVQQVLPDRLHLSELEVEKLSVNEIQAKKIVVSDIDSQTMQVSEVTSRSGTLVLNGVELPPDVLQSLATQVAVGAGAGASAVQKVERKSGGSPRPQPIRMVTPPPPIVVSPSSPEAVSVPLPQRAEASGPDRMPKPKATRSKGRKYNSRMVDDSEDELAAVMHDQEEHEKSATPLPQEESEKKEELDEKTESESIAPEPKAEPPSARTVSVGLMEERRPTSAELLGQLLAIWQASLAEGASAVVRGVNCVFPEAPDKRRDAQTAACILLVLIAGLIMIGFGTDNTVHHHHWDYVPPRY